jgi:hypothetical protein
MDRLCISLSTSSQNVLSWVCRNVDLFMSGLDISEQRHDSRLYAEEWFKSKSLASHIQEFLTFSRKVAEGQTLGSHSMISFDKCRWL